MKTKLVISAFTVILLAFGLSACSVKADSKSESQSITYSYTCNHCATGEHSFDSKEAYCDSLLDEGTNNSCCRSIREEAYGQQCR